MSIKKNRFRLDSMSDDELAKFLFSEEFEYIKQRFGEGPKSFSKWLQEEYDDEYPYKVVEITISHSKANVVVSEFTYGEIEVGDKLVLMPIDGEPYMLTVYQIKYPMHIGEQYYAKARFDDMTNIPLNALADVPYRGCKVIKTKKNRTVEVYLV